MSGNAYCMPTTFSSFSFLLFKILLFVDACHSTSVMNAALIYYWSAIRGLENTLSMFNTLHHLLDFVRFCRILLYRWRTWRVSNFALIAFLLQRQQDLAVRFLVVPFFFRAMCGSRKNTDILRSCRLSPLLGSRIGGM